MSGPTVPEHNEDEYGFRWGPVVVQRYAEFQRPKGELCRVLGIESDAAPTLHIYVSPTGRSVRVYRNGKELT